MSGVRTHLVKVGNSRGVRLPKALLEQAGLEDEVVLDVGPEGILIRSGARPRAGWGEQFRLMAKLGDNQLLDPPTPTAWDETEWEW